MTGVKRRSQRRRALNLEGCAGELGCRLDVVVNRGERSLRHDCRVWEAVTELDGYRWNRGNIHNAGEMKRETSAIKE